MNATYVLIVLVCGAIAGSWIYILVQRIRRSVAPKQEPKPVSAPRVITVLERRPASKKAEPLLSSDDMIISGELPLLDDQEDQSQIETQPIPTAKRAAAGTAGSYPSGVAPPFDLEELKELLRGQMMTPLDYEFPPYMAVVDACGRQAIPVALAGKKAPEEEFDLTLEDKAITMKWRSDCTRVQAFLFVRPFVRVVWPREEWAIDHLRSMRATVEINGDRIAEDVPIDSWIVKFDGQGVTGLPYKFVHTDSLGMLLLWGHEFNRDNALVGAPLGPALSDEHEITITLKRCSTPAIRIVVGCVMGLYTTTP